MDGGIRENRSGISPVLHIRSARMVGSPEKLLAVRSGYMRARGVEYILVFLAEGTDHRDQMGSVLAEAGPKNLLLDGSVSSFRRNLGLLKGVVERERPRIVCSHSYKANVYARVLGRACSLPTIAVYHGRTLQDWKVRLYYFLDNLILKGFDAVVCVSEKTRGQALEATGHKRIVTIPNAVDVGAIAEAASGGRAGEALSGPGFSILFAGRLSREKGLDVLLGAARILEGRIGDFTIHLFGEGPEEGSLKRLAGELGVSGRVHFHGHVPDIYPHLASCSLMVLPSLTEGMPVVVLEAFALGRPVVATRVGGVPEVIEDGSNGLLVPAGDDEALAEAIESVYRDPVLAARIGRGGREAVLEKFTFERQSDRFIGLYEDTVSAEKPRPGSTP